MVDVTDLGLNLDGWACERRDPTRIVWRGPDGDGIAVYFFGLPTDLGAPLDDVERLRVFFKDESARTGVGLVEVDVVDAAAVPAVRTIIKTPQQPAGLTYVASLTIPFAEFSFVVKAQCLEGGVTGIREAVVLDLLLNAGTVQVSLESGKEPIMRGWSQHPYDPGCTGPVLRNRADDVEWDDKFPDHPLSRCRRNLAAAQSGLTLSAAVRAAPPYSGPPSKPPGRPKSFWRFGRRRGPDGG